MSRVVLGAAVSLLLALFGGWVAPSPAHAFQGEGVVETPSATGGGNTLTGPARSILESPTFLQETYTDANTAGDGTAALDFLGGSELIPEAGAALPWVAGATAAAIGVVVACNAIIGSCIDFSALTGDPAVSEKVTWTQTGVAAFISVNGSTKSKVYIAPKTYYTTAPSAWFEDWENVCGKGKGTGLHLPSERTGLALRADDSYNCPPITVGASTMAIRSGSANRQIKVTGSMTPDGTGSIYSGPGYCGAGGSTCTEAPPATWPEQTATCLDAPVKCDMSTSQRDRLGEHVASAIDGSGVADPYHAYVEIPDCSGMVWTRCKAVVEEVGLSPERKVLGKDGAYIDQPPAWVVKTKPSTEHNLLKGKTVVVTTNPDVMPIVMPQPLPGETAEQYAARLKQLDPKATPTIVTLPESEIDSRVGPHGVSVLSPAAGTRLDPSKTESVEIKENPATAPPVPGGSAGTCNATTGAINWSPLNQPLGSKFPFGVVGFFTAWVGEWAGSFPAPKFGLTLIPAGVFGSKGLTMHVDLSRVEAIVTPVRLAFLFLSFVGFLWFLATAAAKVQGDSS